MRRQTTADVARRTQRFALNAVVLAADEMRTAPRQCGGEKVTIVRFSLKQYVPPLYCCLQWLQYQLGRDGSWTTATHTAPSASRASSETKRAQKAAPRTGGGLLAFQTIATTVSDARNGRWRSGRATRNIATF
jgi:hypothetical protein